MNKLKIMTMVTNFLGSLAYATGGIAKVIGNKTKKTYNHVVYGNRNRYRIVIIVKDTGQILREFESNHEDLLKLLDINHMYGTGIRIDIETIRGGTQ
tara:strand:+ start:852 stop:1142 length:291 start_codon:yes stop_codon:yes gene_type:complete